MQLPTSTPLAALAAGALAIGGLAAGTAFAGAGSGPASPEEQVVDEPVRSSGPTTTVRGGDDVVDDVSGPCDEAEHAGDPRCAAAAAAPTPTAATAPPRSGAPAAAPVPGASTAPAPTHAAGDVRSFAAADAGTVVYRIDGHGFTLLDAAPAPGWAVDVEQGAGDELDLDFRRGTVRVQVDVEWEDGGVRERVRVRDDADEQRTETDTTVAPAPAPATTATTSTTVDDHGGDVDREDRIEAGDDRSGSGDDRSEDDDHDDRRGSDDDHPDD